MYKKSQIPNPKSQISTKYQNAKGFTLVELIVVIGILAILAGFILVLVDPLAQFQKANDARRKSDLSQLQKILEQYYEDTGMYPLSTGSTGNKTTWYHIKDTNGNMLTWGQSTWTPYINLLPKDPNDPAKEYIYAVSSDRQQYWLYASLERGKNDPQACNGGNACAGMSLNGNGIDANACGTTCNYGVSSTNTTP